jgi:hypothetical protein
LRRHNYFLRFRFRLLTIYGSAKVRNQITVPVPLRTKLDSYSSGSATLNNSTREPTKRKLRNGEAPDQVSDTIPSSNAADPDPYVFRPHGSRSVIKRSGTGSFYHQAKIVIKKLIPTVL